ncbi:MAG: hypothetical protein QOE05_3409 [Actinomycetota bacterium]|nr:hypothetical protein [Actinomycetota bacterium]
MTLAGAVLAHGGGAPEAATIIVPLAIVIAFVVRERQNVRRLREAEEQEREDEPPATSVEQ